MSNSTLNEQQAQTTAAVIYSGFRRYREEFAHITSAAKQRFESSDWSGVQVCVTQRLKSYHEHIAQVMALAPDLQPGSKLNHWPSIKAAYSALIDQTVDAELAETFFNSIHREHTEDGPCHAQQMYLYRGEANLDTSGGEIFRTYKPFNGVVTMVKDILNDFGFNLAWRDQDLDVANIFAFVGRRAKRNR